MDPTVWGPGFWHVLYDTAVQVDSSAQSSNRVFFQALLIAVAFLLPCSTCQQSLSCFVQTQPLAEDVTCLAYIYRLKNQVSTKLHSTSPELSWEHFQARAYTWTHFGSAENLLDVLALVGLSPVVPLPQWSKYMSTFLQVLSVLNPYPLLQPWLVKKVQNQVLPLSSPTKYLKWLYTFRRYCYSKWHVSWPDTLTLDVFLKRYFNALSAHPVPVPPSVRFG